MDVILQLVDLLLLILQQDLEHILHAQDAAHSMVVNLASQGRGDREGGGQEEKQQIHPVS